MGYFDKNEQIKCEKDTYEYLKSVVKGSNLSETENLLKAMSLEYAKNATATFGHSYINEDGKMTTETPWTLYCKRNRDAIFAGSFRRYIINMIKKIDSGDAKFLIANLSKSEIDDLLAGYYSMGGTGAEKNRANELIQRLYNDLGFKSHLYTDEEFENTRDILKKDDLTITEWIENMGTYADKAVCYSTGYSMKDEFNYSNLKEFIGVDSKKLPDYVVERYNNWLENRNIFQSKSR